jgi:hypothetical protein
LLRVSRERPRSRRPAQKFDELAPPHCLARRSGRGIVAAQTCTGKGPGYVRFG